MRLVLALVLALTAAGCLVESPAEAPDREAVETDASSLRPVTAEFSGVATGTPAAPFVEDFPFEVPRGAVGVNGTLAWAKPPVEAPLGLADTFDLQLLDPAGDVVAEGRAEPDGSLSVVTVEPPHAGTWTFRVSSRAAIDTPFTLEVAADLIVPEHNTIVRSLTLNAFYEVNLILEEGASFRFSYNSSAPIAWDIHSHPDGEVKYWERGEGTTAESNFTAPFRDVFSILWENTGALPTELSFEVDGRFRVHSHSG